MFQGQPPESNLSPLSAKVLSGGGDLAALLRAASFTTARSGAKNLAWFMPIWHHRLVERDHDIDELLGILMSDDQRYLADGFIVTDNGRYVGLGTSDHFEPENSLVPTLVSSVA
jgi:hypothetical protein